MLTVFLRILFLTAPLTAFSLEMEEAKVPIGQCKELDSYLYYCKPFSCSMPIPIPTNQANLQMSVLGEKDGQCYYSLFFEVITVGEVVPWKIVSKCVLSPQGKIEAVKEFQEYKKGNIKIYMRSSKNPILKKECSHQPG